MNMQSTAYLLDRDISSRRNIENLLITAGYNVKAFTSFEEFENVLGPDISGFIIIDIGMLRMSGVEFLNILKNQGISAPIIVVSADDDTSSMKKAKELKAVSFFRKPVDGTALLDTVEWTLKTNSSNDNGGKV
jgi:FixJ family two-component response regulator